MSLSRRGPSNLAEGDRDAFTDVFVRDLLLGTTTLVSAAPAGQEPDSASTEPAISDDGRHVAFKSLSGNLVTGDSNGSDDIFVRDLDASTTERVSVSTSGEQAGQTAQPRRSTRPGDSSRSSRMPRTSFPADTNGPTGPAEPSSQGDVFVRDRVTDRPDE